MLDLKYDRIIYPSLPRLLDCRNIFLADAIHNPSFCKHDLCLYSLLLSNTYFLHLIMAWNFSARQAGLF